MFIKEWDELKNRTHNKKELLLLRQVGEMAERCGSKAHLYLKFYGD
jgi:hypothetical protein